MKRMYWVVGAVGMLAGVLVMSQSQPKPTVAVAQAASGPAKPEGATVVAPGRVEPISEEVHIGTEIDGKLASVPVEEGARVRRGQVIATLVNGDFAARVQLAESAIREREADLEKLRNGARPQERREAESVVDEARAVLAHARSERDRRQFLLDKGAISRTEFEMAEREFQVASARVEAVRQRSFLVSADTRYEDIRRVEAEIASGRARLAEARASLAKTMVVSPIDGVVLRKHKRTGESVSTQSNAPVLTLGDLSRLRVRVDIDETDVARIAVGQRVTFKAGAYGDRAFNGTVSRIGNILGKKNIRTDEPTERVDTKVLETLVDLDPGTELPVGLRVDAYIATKASR